jgi:hypothetical protein
VAVANSPLIAIGRGSGAFWARDVEIKQVAWRYSKVLFGGNVALSCCDARMAAQLYQRGVAVRVIENALVLAAARRLVCPADAPPLARFVRWHTSFR